MYAESTLFIIEYLWSRQSKEASTFCLNSISNYFTAMVGRDSRAYNSKIVLNCIENLV